MLGRSDGTDMTESETTNGALGREILRYLAANKKGRTDHLALENARRNSVLVKAGRGRSIASLRMQVVGEGDSVIILGAGPSLWRQNPAIAIRESGYKGAIIATEAAIAYCLRNGVVPHLTLTVDPDDKRMIRFFGDPSLSAQDLDRDDYFRRLKRDFHLDNELAANAEVVALLNEHGPRMKVALATSASAPVVDRILDIGMDAYWWNPMLDDPDEEGSVIAEIAALNGLPCINAGGNVGTAAWMMAHVVLGKKHVAVTGLDFSYPADTPYERTHYYREAVELVGEKNLDEFFMHIQNPSSGEWFYTDPAYLLYRDVLLELSREANCTTYNCTEGGILFGGAVVVSPLQTFLNRFARA
jgi:hypothetical protein